MDAPHPLRTLQKKRTSNFREDETKLLIQLWGSPQIQNKLYLTHRKAPVMRLLAANMQRHGFYRTPDEIKTRIRNLKCLYHRIKRTVQSGTGIGTVDPDWPHYKAMDHILSNQGKKENPYKDNILEGPRCEDIKQEVEEIDINDDMDSYTTNSMGGSDYEDDRASLPPLIPAPGPGKEDDISKTKQFQKVAITRTAGLSQNNQLSNLLSNFTIPLQTQQLQQNGVNCTTRPGTLPSLPFPLLIVQSQKPANGTAQADNSAGVKVPTIAAIQQPQKNVADTTAMTTLLKDLLDVQKENLSLEKQRYDLEKQRLELERLVGSQILRIIPSIGGLLQRLGGTNNAEEESSSLDNSARNGRKRANSNDLNLLKDSKILKKVLEQGIKKYMMGGTFDSDSENEDSGILTQNDENSSSSNK